MPTISHSPQQGSLALTEEQKRLLKWIQQLNTDDLDLLNETVQHLTQHADVALPLMLEALVKAEEEIRKNLSWVLGFIRHPSSLVPLFSVMNTDSSLDVRLGASWALRQFDLPSLSQLVFTKLPPPQNLDEIKAYMSSKSWKARWFCTLYLTYHQEQSCIEALLKLAKADENTLVRCSAILSLAAYGNPEVNAELRLLLSDINDQVKVEVISVLSLKNDREAVADIARQLEAYNENVRVAAVSALGALGSAAEIPHLAKALKDDADLVRINAAMALFDIAQRLKHKNRNIADLCFKALKDKNIYVVKNAARTLGLAGDEDILRELIILLKQEKHPAITSNLVQALGMFRDPRALKILGKLLRHESWEVRFEVVQALSLLKGVPKQVYPLLLQAIRDPALLVKEQAIRALGKLGDTRAIPHLEKLKLQHPYGAVNKSIALALDDLLGL